MPTTTRPAIEARSVTPASDPNVDLSAEIAFLDFAVANGYAVRSAGAVHFAGTYFTAKAAWKAQAA